MNSPMSPDHSPKVRRNLLQLTGNRNDNNRSRKLLAYVSNSLRCAPTGSPCVYGIQVEDFFQLFFSCKSLCIDFTLLKPASQTYSTLVHNNCTHSTKEMASSQFAIGVMRPSLRGTQANLFLQNMLQTIWRRAYTPICNEITAEGSCEDICASELIGSQRT